MGTGTTGAGRLRAAGPRAGRIVAVALLVAPTACDGGAEGDDAVDTTVATVESSDAEGRTIGGTEVVDTGVASPATSPPMSIAWAEEAVQWFEARDEAAKLGIANFLRFVAPGVVHDGVALGRADYGSHLQRDDDWSIRQSTIRAVYLDTLGALVGRARGLGSDSDYLTELEIDHTGMATREVEANTSTGYMYNVPESVAARAIARAYLKAWSTLDGESIRSLYTPEAVLVDSLQRLELAGDDSIVAYALDQASSGTSLASGEDSFLGGDETDPNVFYSRDDRLPNIVDDLQVFLLYTGDDGSGCPGEEAVVLHTSDGRIVTERRYHEIASVRRCWDTERLPDGWWTGLRAPARYEDVVTGAVSVAGQRIEIHNGTAALERLVQWAMARFEAAELTVPAVASVTFDEDSHAPQCTVDRRTGLTIDLGNSAQLFICLAEDDACEGEGCTGFVPNARLLVLHELAHAWMLRQLDVAVQGAFMDQMGLEEWSSAELPWYDRGVEQAAQVIAWGLMDEPIELTRLDRSSEQLVEGFRLLTGRQPPRALAGSGTG